MAYFGSLTNVRAQFESDERFGAALGYLDELVRPGSEPAERLRSLAIGETRRIELSGGAFALEQAYRSKPRAEGFFESHRTYIDVQVVVEGTERMEVTDISRAREEQAYDAGRDLIKYAGMDEASVLQLVAGEAAVFFPPDVHMPALAGESGPQLVRKIVVKVPVECGSPASASGAA